MSPDGQTSSLEMALGGPTAYAEFGLLHENAAEQGLSAHNMPIGSRVEVVGPTLTTSAIRWGSDDPALVLLHGGGQNAHTWDSLMVLLGSGWPALAIDLPGHGHSAGGFSTDADQLAHDIGPILDRYVREPVMLCGMSLGGLVALVLAASRPEVVSHLILVDVVPGVDGVNAQAILGLLNGPGSFDSFEDLVAGTAAAFPDRPVSELRRGILHNAAQQPDGSWQWRYSRSQSEPKEWAVPDTSSLWPYLEGCAMPVLLVRGTRSTSVLRPQHEAEFRRRVPSAQIAYCDAGHNVQSDVPGCLASHIRTFAHQLG